MPFYKSFKTKKNMRMFFLGLVCFLPLSYCRYNNFVRVQKCNTIQQIVPFVFSQKMDPDHYIYKNSTIMVIIDIVNDSIVKFEMLNANFIIVIAFRKPTQCS